MKSIYHTHIQLSGNRKTSAERFSHVMNLFSRNSPNSHSLIQKMYITASIDKIIQMDRLDYCDIGQIISNIVYINVIQN